ncbi:MAG: hypothetical protein ACSHXD_09770 [Marinosulfonomonas sp.]
MIATAPIGWLNTGLPVAVLALAAVLLPGRFVAANTRSHQAVVIAIALTALVTILLGAAVFAMVYWLSGAGVAAALSDAPLATTLYFFRLSLMAALLWGPVLALVWFSMAQSVEKRRGQDIARGSA